ncbi:small-conductance mechanosensitive channel [Roseovarius sp. MBR-154]|jgi:small-conductance mechanosensitive channel
MTDLLRILIAPLVWLASFSAVYAVHGLVCGHDISGTLWGVPLSKLLLWGAYLVALVLQAALLTALYHPRARSASRFVRRVSRITGWVGLVATAWSLFPVAVTSPCL